MVINDLYPELIKMVEDYYKWIEDPSLLNADTLPELKRMLDAYPYCQSVRFLYLKNLYQQRHPDFFSEVQRSSVFVSDRHRLFYYLSIKEDLWNDVFDFYLELKTQKRETAEADTFSLIDTFLQDYAPSRLQQTIPRPTQKAARMAIATQDYASLLLAEEQEVVSDEPQQETKLKHHDLIDDFINYASTGDSIREQLMSPKEITVVESQPVDNEIDILEEEDLLTESLAKIYIKQKRYYKAIEIIKKLSLKYPEKSIYFADQIRFLEKLISNIKKA